MVVIIVIHSSPSLGELVELVSPVDVTSRRAPSFDAAFARIARTSARALIRTVRRHDDVVVDDDARTVSRHHE